MSAATDGDWAAMVKDMLLERPHAQSLRDSGADIEAGVDKPVGYAAASGLVLLTLRGGTEISTGAVSFRNLYVRCYAPDEVEASRLYNLTHRALNGHGYKKIRMITPSALGQEAREPETGFPFVFATYKLQTTL